MTAKPGELTVDIHTDDNGLTIVAVVGDLDILTGPRLHTALNLALDKQPRRLLVDLTEVTFLSVTGLKILTQVDLRARPATRFSVVATGTAARLLRLTHLDTVFAVHPDRPTALAVDPTNQGVEER